MKYRTYDMGNGMVQLIPSLEEMASDQLTTHEKIINQLMDKVEELSNIESQSRGIEEHNEMWVARDEDGALALHTQKPVRESDYWNNGDECIEVPSTLFPNLKWEAEPMKIDLVARIYT